MMHTKKTAGVDPAVFFVADTGSVFQLGSDELAVQTCDIAD